MRSLRFKSLAGLIALPLIACGGGATQGPVALPMQDHWEAGQDLWAAMTEGDLATARMAAGRIADVSEVQGLAWDAGPYLRQMRREAQNVEDAADFGVAALATGRLGVACGSCHSRVEDGPKPPGVSTAPSTEETTEQHMLGHQWAMDRMWEGLVVPSVDRWRSGARILADHKVSAVGLNDAVGFLAARVHEQGEQALNDRTPAARGDRFGRILSDCAACHAEMGRY